MKIPFCVRDVGTDHAARPHFTACGGGHAELCAAQRLASGAVPFLDNNGSFRGKSVRNRPETLINASFMSSHPNGKGTFGKQTADMKRDVNKGYFHKKTWENPVKARLLRAAENGAAQTTEIAAQKGAMPARYRPFLRPGERRGF